MIAQGIQKGIADYKKQQGIKLRAIDKQRKQKARQPQDSPAEPQAEIANNSSTNYLPWILLALSWAGFLTYFIWQ